MIRKVHDTKGLIVAFVGVDGSGKSTVTKEIHKWLRRKIECKRFYMGSGDGKLPMSMRLLNAVTKRAGKAKTTGIEENMDAVSGRIMITDGKESGNRGVNDNVNDGKGTVESIKDMANGIGTGKGENDRVIQPVSIYRQPFRYIRRMLRMKAVYDVQYCNFKKIRIMQRYRLNGGISILDRYPQIEITGRNDGPKLVEHIDRFVEKGWITSLMKKEMRCLGIVREIKPDIIFRLNIRAETSMERKPEQRNIESFRRKIRELERISFQGARIIDIDAEQPYDDELLKIKKILWNSM